MGDWNKSGSHSMIGELETSVDALLQLSRGTELPLVNQKKKSKKKERYRNSGLLIVRSCQLETRPTFLDFIQGGMELSFTVAVELNRFVCGNRGWDKELLAREVL